MINIGNRQSDLKDERRRAQMASARQVLERSTMMLLTSSKVMKLFMLRNFLDRKVWFCRLVYVTQTVYIQRKIVILYFAKCVVPWI